MGLLKVKDWYLKKVREVEYEKLTGHAMVDTTAFFSGSLAL